MDLVRVGHKLISRSRIIRRIDEMLAMRVAGKSQKETSDALDVDRTFVSRLEALGEVRKGGKVALIGFPVKNKEEVMSVASEEGVDFSFVLTEDERLRFASDRSGADLVNEMMGMVAELKEYDAVVFLGSDKRIEMVEAMLGRDVVIGIELGRSPITQDVPVNVRELAETIRKVKADPL